MNIKINSSLRLVPIEIRKDKKHYIVENKISSEFYEMPEICIDAINLINHGKILAEIECQLKDKYPKEDVNLVDFALQLQDLHLIEVIDGINVVREEKKKEQLGFLWLSPRIGKFFFNKFSYYLYGTLFILNIVLLLTHSYLFPHYKDLFLFDYMALNIPAWIVITFLTVFIHEFGHVLAIRAKNLPTKLGAGHRLFVVVLETDMSSVWKLPLKERNVLFLAGLCFDTVILSIALLSQLIAGDGSEIFLGIMNIIVLDTFIRMIYQLCIYMKTDFYYVLENVSGCYNLMENAQRLIRRKLPLLKFNEVEDEVFDGERKTVFIYSIFYLIGVGLTVSLYVFFYIPQLLFAWKKVLPGFSYGAGSISFWDAFFSLFK
ncbi:hypothetical protein [Neobacillus cucumis]|uniref:hypothetical protein n=1 Tax=Neobacillus cucumis TaxID=1740721 RepID=UPI001EF7F97D|nr:hypothetical protein [Neobacillus cucumis]MBM7650712.1 hypothetical protein [Neobacillus cucumis]